jgi:hypothetical protein
VSVLAAGHTRTELRRRARTPAARGQR